MTIRQSNIQSSNHRLSSIEKKSHARLEPPADCGMPPPPSVHQQRQAASRTSAASARPRAAPTCGCPLTARPPRLALPAHSAAPHSCTCLRPRIVVGVMHPRLNPPLDGCRWVVDGHDGLGIIGFHFGLWWDNALPV